MSDGLESHPALNGVHHIAITVTDVEASAAWYETVFGTQQLPMAVPHFGAEESGYAVVLIEPATGFTFGLHHHTANTGDRADERRTGLDHLSFAVAERSDLDAWAAWLTLQNVAHAGVNDVVTPFSYSTLVFRDPDNIQLEFIYQAHVT